MNDPNGNDTENDWYEDYCDGCGHAIANGDHTNC